MCVDGNILDITELAKCTGLMYEADGVTLVGPMLGRADSRACIG